MTERGIIVHTFTQFLCSYLATHLAQYVVPSTHSTFCPLDGEELTCLARVGVQVSDGRLSRARRHSTPNIQHFLHCLCCYMA
jgi:hypothetical protein